MKQKFPLFFGLSREKTLIPTKGLYFVFALFILLVPASSAFTADTDEIETVTRDLCNLSRFTGSEEEATEYISEKMCERGLAVTVESFEVPVETSLKVGKDSEEQPVLIGSNVIGVKEGKSNRTVIVCAHYDTAAPEHPGEEYPGADDNAAGVASMLEVARLLQDEDLDRTLCFIAFSGEDVGLFGSKKWLDAHEDCHDEIIAAINLDCVAYGDSLRAVALPQHRWLYEWLPESGSISYDRAAGVAMGDEFRFQEHHLPVIRLIDNGDHVTIWDTPDDRPERLNYTLAAECAGAVAGGIAWVEGTGDLTPPECVARVENGTIYYDSSEDLTYEVIVNDQNLGTYPSGAVSLPHGTHEVDVVGYDPAGNRQRIHLTAEGGDLDLPVAANNSVGIAIPGKRSQEVIETSGLQKWLAGIRSLAYTIKRPKEVAEVTGFIDGIRIAELPSENSLLLTPGNHTYLIVAYGEDGEVVGSDETTFIERSRRESFCFPPENNPFYEPEGQPVMMVVAGVVLVLALVVVYRKRRRH
ncbi:Zn-dependent exopeptidase M28 [Methanofollis aquaemaris]|uniref:Zn-dependent exopeptidase M28 n=1 Tax=Methanofollis aquaemaris TaxID=126734 RepID=A0A8A3S808_9EURY|nr:M28 family peptidase [Methanofollis aquaemaris]QSZ68268.1 Zn-dependent exopeptidase M28 [Methanofollis aquaemaris]